jgi:hypothetical protein
MRKLYLATLASVLFVSDSVLSRKTAHHYYESHGFEGMFFPDEETADGQNSLRLANCNSHRRRCNHARDVQPVK